MNSAQEAPLTGSGGPAFRDPREITDFSDFFDAMASEAKGFVTSEREYLTLLLAKRAADTSRAVVGAIVAVIIVAACVLFGSIAGAIALGRVFGDLALGCLAVAGLYALVLVIFLAMWRGSAGERFKLGIINLLYGN